MSKDVRLFCICDHIVSDTHYDPDHCPRCYGKGYYYDIYFDHTGKAVLAENGIKLKQEILKVLLDEKGSNVFHPKWGSRVFDLIGTKNLNINAAKLELMVKTALERLKNLQYNEHKKYKHMSQQEILNKVESIVAIPLSVTGFRIKVVISNENGENFAQSFDVEG
jgi:hypothetical protein